MSDDTPLAEAPASSAASSAASAQAAPGGGRSDERTADRAGRESGELLVALSPRQIIGGFAFLAGLIVWLLRRGRRKG